MVQKKGPDIPTTMAGSRKSRSMVEKKNSCPPQDRQDHSEHKEVAELRKKLKKARTMRRISSQLEDLGSHLGRQYVQHKKIGARKKPSSLAGMSEDSRPNYMKSTTCSDARKERLQVSFHGPTTGGKERSPGGGVHNRSRFCSSSTASSSSSPPSWNSRATANKGAKASLMRKSSLKLVRPRMKKILGPPLFPKINASRATCSSTIKDSRFPKELELSPGATELEGTSAMRVCPFTYCSLNGHRHQPLPPLKTFVSSRRRLLMNQKSMRLKSVPSFRRRGWGKCDKRITIPSLTDQVDDDFFVEIYANLSENTRELVFDQSDDTCPTNVDIEDDVGPGNFSEISSVSGFGDFAKIKSSDGNGDDSSLKFNSEESPERQCGNLGPVLEFPVIKCTESDDQEEDDDHSECSTGKEPPNEIRHLAENEAQDLLPDDVQEPVVVDHDDVVLGYLDDGLAEEDVPSTEKQAQEALDDNGSLKNLSHFGGDVSECEDAYSDETDDKESLEGIRVIVLEEQAQEVVDDNGSLKNLSHFSGDVSECEDAYSDETDDKESLEGIRVNVLEEHAQEAAVDNGSLKNLSHFGGDVSECEDAFSDETDDKESLEGIRVNVLEEHAQEAAVEDGDIAEDGQVGHDSPQNEAPRSDGAGHNQGDVNVHAAFGVRCDEIPEPHSPEVGLAEVNEEDGNGNLNDNYSYSLVFMASEEDSFEEETANATNEERECSQGMDGKKEYAVEVGERGLADENSDINIKELEADQSTKTEKEEVECHALHGDAETKDQNDGPEGTICKSEMLVPDCTLIEANPNTVQGNDNYDAKAEELKNEAAASDEKAIEALCDHGGFDEDAVTKNENSDLAVTTSVPEMLAPDHSLVEANPNAALGNDAKAELKNEAPLLVDHLDDGNKHKSEIDQVSATGERKSTNEWDDGLIYGTQKDDDMIDPGEDEEFPFVGSDWAEEAMADTDLTSISSSIPSEIGTKLKSRYNYTRKVVDDHDEEQKPFNPRPPNFLPVEPDAEEERVDLKHQMMDDRKNAEEWMVDYALRRVDEEFPFVGSDWAEEAIADTDLTSISSPIPSEIGTKLKSRYNYTRKVVDDHDEEQKPFNPRPPNFLPVEPDAEAERVDLKHQMMDDRKNAEEWMVDYALQRVVSKLAPARKKKVELLVEAFETVDGHGSPVFAHSRPIQACS